MKIKLAISLAGLAIVAAPAAFGQTLTLDGTFDPSLTALDGGTPVYDYSFTGANPVVISGQLTGAPAGATLDSTSLTPDPSTTGNDLIGALPTSPSTDLAGNYPVTGVAPLAEITVPNSGLDPNNIGNYFLGGEDANGTPFGAAAGFHIIAASAVPEPGSIAMLLGMVGGGAAFLRRRR